MLKNHSLKQCVADKNTKREWVKYDFSWRKIYFHRFPLLSGKSENELVINMSSCRCLKGYFAKFKLSAINERMCGENNGWRCKVLFHNLGISLSESWLIERIVRHCTISVSNMLLKVMPILNMFLSTDSLGNNYILWQIFYLSPLNYK